ncbi:MAG TPA: phosphatase [Chryseosolibacter sp.]
MKHLVSLLLTLFSIVTIAQKKTDRDLVPARGHYKQLSSINAAPVQANLEVDKLKFETPQPTIERRMELKPHYLTTVTVNDFKIPEVPANSSQQTRAELNYLLALQNQRTDLEVQSSLKMAGIYYNLRVKPEDSTYQFYRNNLFHIGHSIGTWFTPDNLPVTANFMANVWRDASYFIWSLKFKYARVRPKVLDKSIHNLEETDWPAYPSGHAANSYINAYIYQELAPQFTDIFTKDAYDMAHSREILGVHYPSDSESSRIFARQFVNKLFSNEQFLKDFEEVKKEWKEKAHETFEKPQIIKAEGASQGACGVKTSECIK